jgi:hypothetical protein
VTLPKRLLSPLLAAACLFLPPSPSLAAEVQPLGPSFAERRSPTWAFGLQLGAPSGVTAKRYLGRDALDLLLGGFYGPGLRFGADYLWGAARFLPDDPSVSFDLYVGVGGFVGDLSGPCDGFSSWQGSCNGDTYLGARAPLGLEVSFRRAPFTIGLEVAPGFAFAHDRSGLLLDGALTVRFLL